MSSHKFKLKRLKNAGDEILRVLEKFMPLYTEWSENRTYVCNKVKQLADEIDEHHHNANIAQTVGGVVGTLASPIAVAGVALAPFTGGLTLLFGVPASVAVGAAAITSAGARITDRVIQSTNKRAALHFLHVDHVCKN